MNASLAHRKRISTPRRFMKQRSNRVIVASTFTIEAVSPFIRQRKSAASLFGVFAFLPFEVD